METLWKYLGETPPVESVLFSTPVIDTENYLVQCPLSYDTSRSTPPLAACILYDPRDAVGVAALSTSAQQFYERTSAAVKEYLGDGDRVDSGGDDENGILHGDIVVPASSSILDVDSQPLEHALIIRSTAEVVSAAFKTLWRGIQSYGDSLVPLGCPPEYPQNSPAAMPIDTRHSLWHHHEDELLCFTLGCSTRAVCPVEGRSHGDGCFFHYDLYEGVMTYRCSKCPLPYGTHWPIVYEEEVSLKDVLRERKPQKKKKKRGGGEEEEGDDDDEDKSRPEASDIQVAQFFVEHYKNLRVFKSQGCPLVLYGYDPTDRLWAVYSEEKASQIVLDFRDKILVPAAVYVARYAAHSKAFSSIEYVLKARVSTVPALGTSAKLNSVPAAVVHKVSNHPTLLRKPFVPDSRVTLLSFSNRVVLDLITWKARPREKNDYCSVTTGYPFTALSACEQRFGWDFSGAQKKLTDALWLIANSNKEDYELLLDYLAYSLFGYNTKKSYLHLFGRPNAGKSFLINLLDSLLGAYQYVVCLSGAFFLALIPFII
jgi:hypothetical protein